MLVTSNSSFSNSVFFTFGELSFSSYGIQNCRLKTLSVWKSLKMCLLRKSYQSQPPRPPGKIALENTWKKKILVTRIFSFPRNCTIFSLFHNVSYPINDNVTYMNQILSYYLRLYQFKLVLLSPARWHSHT